MNKRLPLLIRDATYNLRGGFLVRPLIIALALGDPEQGARVPVPAAAGEKGETFLEYQGQPVRSKADFATLEQVAKAR